MAIANMTDVYYQLVKEGVRTIKQVPTAERASVQEKLDADKQAETEV